MEARQALIVVARAYVLDVHSPNRALPMATAYPRFAKTVCALWASRTPVQIKFRMVMRGMLIVVAHAAVSAAPISAVMWPMTARVGHVLIAAAERQRAPTIF